MRYVMRIMGRANGVREPETEDTFLQQYQAGPTASESVFVVTQARARAQTFASAADAHKLWRESTLKVYTVMIEHAE